MKSEKKNSKDFITTGQAEQLAKGIISMATIIRLFDKGVIPGTRPARQRMIHKESFLVFLRSKANGYEARALVR